MSSKWKIHKRKKVAKEDLIRDFNYSGIELEEDGLYGLDDPPGMETNTEGMDNIDFTQDYDTKPDANIDENEHHILFGNSVEFDEEYPAMPEEPPYDPKIVIKHKIPNISKSVKEYQRKKSGKNLRKIILDLIDMLPNTIHYGIEYAMYHYCYFAYKGSKDWPKYEEAHAEACDTIMKLITIPTAAVVVLNWWYLMNYTDYYIDTDKIFDSFPFSAIDKIIQPTKIIIGTINKNLQYRHVGADIESSERSFYRKLWDYRPITISILFMLMYTLLSGVKLTDVLRSAILGTPNPAFYSIMGLSMLLYILLLFSENFKNWMQTYKSLILTGILALLTFIGVVIFSVAGVFIVFYYFVYFSFLFIFVDKWFNLSAVWKQAKQIRTDLIFTNKIFEDDKDSTIKKVANELLRNSFTILTSGAVPVIAITKYFKYVARYKSNYSFESNMMRAFYIGIFLYGAKNLYAGLNRSFGGIFKIIKESISKMREKGENDLGASTDAAGASGSPDAGASSGPADAGASSGPAGEASAATPAKGFSSMFSKSLSSRLGKNMPSIPTSLPGMNLEGALNKMQGMNLPGALNNIQGMNLPESLKNMDMNNLEGSLKKIGESALEQTNLPEPLKKIGESALLNVKLPESLKKMQGTNLAESLNNIQGMNLPPFAQQAMNQ